MPRGTNLGTSSAFEQVRKQARGLLGALRDQIRAMETDLKRLKNEEAQLAALAGREVMSGSAANGSVSESGRVNWTSVLGELPKQFRAADVRKVRSVRDKRSSEIFAGISRWIEAGAVKRKDRGLYERVK